MDYLLPKLLMAVALGASSASACEIKWPNANYVVPPAVMSFIVDECLRYEETTEESVQECIRGEKYGYRAVVTLLADEITHDVATERFRACRAGLGDLGGRFHRRRAECMGSSFGIVWRFEFTRDASFEHHSIIVEALSHHRQSNQRPGPLEQD